MALSSVNSLSAEAREESDDSGLAGAPVSVLIAGLLLLMAFVLALSFCAYQRHRRKSGRRRRKRSHRLGLKQLREEHFKRLAKEKGDAYAAAAKAAPDAARAVYRAAREAAKAAETVKAAETANVTAPASGAATASVAKGGDDDDDDDHVYSSCSDKDSVTSDDDAQPSTPLSKLRINQNSLTKSPHDSNLPTSAPKHSKTQTLSSDTVYFDAKL